MRIFIHAFFAVALALGLPHAAQAQVGPVIAVFAHPDDERVVAPLLSRLAREGRETHLVIATTAPRAFAISPTSRPERSWLPHA